MTAIPPPIEDQTPKKISIVFDRVFHQYQATNSQEVTEAVTDFSMSITKESFVCLLGPSGCGKTTILNLLAGFEKPTRGEILVEGKKVLGPGPDRGVVFQESNLLPWKKVLDNITLGPDLAGKLKSETIKKAEKFIELTGLKGFEKHAPYELSGGMRQRVALARAWISEPPILVMDEPFGALDAQTRLSMQELLIKIWMTTKATVLFVTHDVEEAIFLADRIIIMTPRPGSIWDDLLVPFSRPRKYEDLILEPGFTEIKHSILQAMRHPEYEI
jgi:NitT/TauT family transport system ATP-binding protein